MQLTQWQPTTPTLRDEIDRFFSDLWTGTAAAVTPSAVHPTTDILEGNDAYTIVMELPGLREEQVKVTLEAGILTVTGETGSESREEGATYHRIERRHGAFTRSFRLPNTVDAGQGSAELRNGLLEIRLPKTEQVRPREISVQRK